jgi:hypothetical protein
MEKEKKRIGTPTQPGKNLVETGVKNGNRGGCLGDKG